MALIACEECGKQISDKAHHCVNCGVGIERNVDVSTKNNIYFNRDESNASVSLSAGNTSARTKPLILSLLKYSSIFIAILHIFFAYLGTPMYPQEFLIALYKIGIHLSPISVSVIIAVIIVTITLTTLKIKKRYFPYASMILFLALSFASFQKFYDLYVFQMVWRQNPGSIAVPQAPFALLMAFLQGLSAASFFFPSSSKYFQKLRET